jgi:hypothetical protein
MNHLVVLLPCPFRVLEQRPRVVEEAHGEGAAGGLIEVGGDRRPGHDGLSFRQLGDVVEDALKAVRPRLDSGPVVGQATSTFGRVVRGEDRADLVERHLQLTEPLDRAGGLELIAAVAAIAAGRIDLGRPKEIELVVVAQGADAQPGKPREPSDRQQLVIHARIVNPRAGRESRPAVRRCRARGRSHAG